MQPKTNPLSPDLSYSWRRSVFFALIFLIGPCLLAQEQPLIELNQHRLDVNEKAMYVLGGWAIGNIAVGAIMRSRTEGTTRYFHEMNAFWNLVNLGLAAGGLFGNMGTDPAGLDLWETYHEQNKLERILLFNMALNVSYMVGGAWLMERSKVVTERADRWKGYGQSLILQGGFLLLYDTTHYLLQQRFSAPRLEKIMQHVQVDGQGIGLLIQF
ncbi:MAG: hypothetical protein AAFR61_06265 [Bacteroidota bacterium]